MSCPAVETFASDRRLLDAGLELTGHRFIPYKATLFNKTGKANWLVAWHQDVALPVESEFEADGWGPFTRKAGIIYGHAPTEVLHNVLALRIHLDASTSANGPLRVIAGSHKKRLANDAEFNQVVRNVAPVELTVGRGGVIAMSPLLVHASSKCAADQPRRVLHIEYAVSRDIGPGVRLALLVGRRM
ncbi:MAG TPA: phytanoyl-CoA dioxygenase family protein [Pyrinomonadaceae bacterium]